MSDSKLIAGRSSHAVVHLAAGGALARMALSSEEGFLLSRVGGGLTLADLVATAGLPYPQAEALIAGLLKKGALFEKGTARPISEPTPGPARPAAPAPPADEQVDLPRERQEEILALDAKLGKVNLFELLGIPVGAAPEACKAAYYELSMRLHPDRFYGKNLGSFRPRIDRIFRALTEAQQTLTDREKRAAYQKAHPELFRPASDSPAAHDSLRAEDRARRIARHPYLAKTARTLELLARARKALETGQAAAAVTDLEQLLKIEPGHAEAKRLMHQASSKLEGVRGQQAYEEGQKLANMGDLNGALRQFLSALDRSPSKELCARGFQVAVAANDLKSARSFGQKWAELEPRSARARLALAEVLERSGMVKNAKREAEEALKLEPENKAAKALVAKLRWA